MVAMTRGRFGLALAVLAIACGVPEDRPDATVRDYARLLARDPARTLPLVTDAFHARHALHVATAAEARGVAAGRGDAGDAGATLAVDRLQLGWLVVQSRPDFAERLATLSWAIGDPDQRGDHAQAVARVVPRDAPPFDLRFSLVRDPASHVWRIDAIEPSGVIEANAAAAFVAYPNEAARRALAARSAR
jgi:hypothetical protein